MSSPSIAPSEYLILYPVDTFYLARRVATAQPIPATESNPAFCHEGVAERRFDRVGVVLIGPRAVCRLGACWRLARRLEKANESVL